MRAGSGCYTVGVGVWATGTYWLEAEDAAKHTVMHSTALHTIEYLVQTTTSAETKKP